MSGRRSSRRSSFRRRSRSEEHTSELQSRQYLVCRLLLEKKKQKNTSTNFTFAILITSVRRISLFQHSKYPGMLAETQIFLSTNSESLNTHPLTISNLML